MTDPQNNDEDLGDNQDNTPHSDHDESTNPNNNGSTSPDKSPSQKASTSPKSAGNAGQDFAASNTVTNSKSSEEIKESNKYQDKETSKHTHKPIVFNPVSVNDVVEAAKQIETQQKQHGQSPAIHFNPAQFIANANNNSQEIVTTGGQPPMNPFAGVNPQQMQQMMANMSPEMMAQYQQMMMSAMKTGQFPFAMFQNQGPEFFPIVDCVAEYQKGNFLPTLHLLKHNLIPRDFVDAAGYSYVHNAISYNLVEILLILLDVFKLDVNLKSKTNQTPLMIACNFNFNEIIKILVDRGADLNTQDDSKFTALLYCAKQNSFTSFAYLLYKNADHTITDSNKCTVQHWASYKNNVWQLRLFKRLRFNMWECDAGGFTPLERAVSSDAIDSSKYLIEEATNYPLKMKLEEVTNPAIKEILRRKFFKTTMEQVIADTKEMFHKHCRHVTFGTYLFLWLMMMATYVKCTTIKGYDFIYNLVFLIFSLYFIGYVGWYYLTSDRSGVKKFAYRKIKNTASALDTSITEEATSRAPEPVERMKNMNFSNLNRLTKQDDHEGITVKEEKGDYEYPTFLHELAYYFESNNFREVNSWDHKRYCPTCLKKRPQKSKHCSVCNQCVDHYCHHSYTLGRCIDKTNHVFYLLLLVQQFILVALFLIPPIVLHNPDRTSRWFLFFFETVYLMGHNDGFVYALWYTAFGIMAMYNSFYLWIEVYGIFQNLTFNEIMNRHRYPYLFDVLIDGRGGYINYPRNPNDKGMVKNFKNYFARIMG